MKKQQQTFNLTIQQKFFASIVVVIFTALGVGYGYFWGRYEQIQMNKSVLKPIPEVNCKSQN